jgi:hypothetical protein
MHPLSRNEIEIEVVDPRNVGNIGEEELFGEAVDYIGRYLTNLPVPPKGE